MSGVKHHFSVSVAVEVGVNAAVVLENIAFWVRANISKRFVSEIHQADA